MRNIKIIKSNSILIGFIPAFFAFLFGVFIYGLVTKPTATFKYYPTEPPIAFQANAQNKGTRCIPVYYGLGHGDGVYDPVCSDLENQLGQAAAAGNIEKMKILLRNGADANANTGISLLLIAAEKGQTEAVRLLLDNGADIHYHNWSSGTPLLSAVDSGNPETVELLLSRGANVYLESDGCTALKVARAKNDLAIISLLERAGATK